MELKFGNILRELRKSQGLTQGELAAELGVVFSTISMYERKERLPDIETLINLCNFFNVDANYLLGLGAKPKNTINLTPHESKVMSAYRTQPEMQPAVDRLLGVADDSKIILYAAAKSAENRKPQIIEKSVDKWEEIKATPDTDDELL